MSNQVVEKKWMCMKHQNLKLMHQRKQGIDELRRVESVSLFTEMYVFVVYLTGGISLERHLNGFLRMKGRSLLLLIVVLQQRPLLLK